MREDDYIHVRVPELPDWKIARPIGFHKEHSPMITVEQPRFSGRVVRRERD